MMQAIVGPLLCLIAFTAPACNRDVYDNLFDPVNQYTVTFDSQGGTAVSAQTVDYGSTISQPADPVLTGYTFAGWFTEPGCATPWLFGSGTVQGDATLYARWTINQYTVSFDPQGGSAIAMQTVNHNGYAADPGAPARTGYTFGGWFREAGCVTQWFFPTDTITENRTLFAQWTINTYTLTYTAGANGSLTGTTTQFVTHGSNGTAVTAVPNVGYHFTSWSDGVLSATRTDTGVTGDITVTANFAINQYTLSYSAGANGSLSGSTAQVVNHGASGTAVTAVPNVGYHFVNWNDGSTANPRTDTNVTGTITVSANFAINTYTLTYTAGANGSLTGTTTQLVTHGANGTAVTAVPNVGYHFTSWSDANTDNPRTDTGVTGNITVTANFAINQYTLSYSAGANGSLSGATAQVVNHGASGTAVTAVPNVGYHFTSWSDGPTDNPRTDTAVTGTITVSANFAINQYTLTYTAGVNGSLSGTSPQTVNHGGSGTAVTATPNIGYHFTSWSDGVLTATRTDINVTGAITVTANFAINQYTLSYSAGPNGSLSGSTAQVVNHGASGTAVTAVPNVGYHFTSWSDGPTDNPRTDTAVTGTITVSANFAINQYTLTYTAGANGSLSGTSPQTVNHGGSGTAVTAVPNVGYHFTSWSDGVLTATRTDINVTGAITVTASFAINTYTLTYNAGAGGSITGSSPQTVNHGANGTAVTATPNVGYYFTSWSDGGLIATRTDTNITGDLMVTASFSNEYTVTFDAQSGSTPAPATKIVTYNAAYGALATTARDSYVFSGWWTGPNGTGTEIAAATIVLMTSNHTLYAYWVPANMVFTSMRDGRSQIYVMNAGVQTNVSNNGWNDFNPHYSPDGSRIAFMSTRTGNKEGFIMNADGTNPVNLTNNGADDSGGSWSPDGTKIVFHSNRWSGDRIYIMNSDGSGTTILNPSGVNGGSAVWSPDGTKIAFNSTSGRIYVMNADGTNQQIVSSGLGDWGPSWSPDNTKIAFSSTRTGNREIFVRNADGSGPETNLTNYVGADDDSPSWSPDGTKIAFHSNRDGHYEIYLMGADGSRQTRITWGTSDNHFPSWAHTFANGVIGPGGGYIFYDKGFYSTDGNGTWRYLEAAPVDQSAPMSMLWWNGASTTTGATGTAIGTGKTNTNAIISSQGAGTYAATACTTYSNNGYNDWFLPSRDELIAIRNNLYVFGIGGLNWQDYVSSSEINSTTVYYIYFDNGNTYTVGKNFPKTVRAIRAF